MTKSWRTVLRTTSRAWRVGGLEAAAQTGWEIPHRRKLRMGKAFVHNSSGSAKCPVCEFVARRRSALPAVFRQLSWLQCLPQNGPIDPRRDTWRVGDLAVAGRGFAKPEPRPPWRQRGDRAPSRIGHGTYWRAPDGSHSSVRTPKVLLGWRNAICIL
jgi:hypothetical protein